MATAQAGYAQPYEPPLHDDGRPHYEKEQQSFGAFLVVRNIEDYRAVPILHGPWLIRQASLTWHDSTGAIGFSFVDNGASVRFRPEGKSADGATTCIMQSVIVGYDPKPSTLENWENIQPFVARQLRQCSAIAPADLDRAVFEMKAAGADYVAAANAWKAVAANVFGSGRSRCIAERMVRASGMPPRFECTRYSTP